MGQECLKEYNLCVVISGHKLAGSQELGGRNTAHSSLQQLAISVLVGKASAQPEKVYIKTSKYLLPYLAGLISVKFTSQ